MNVWQVQLEGDIRDLEFLAKILNTGAVRVFHGETGSEYLYESDSFLSCTTSVQVEQVAESEIAVLSGLLKLEREARDGLNCGAVYRRNPDGGRHIFMRAADSFEVRVELGTATVVITDAEGNNITQPEPPHRFLMLLQLSAADAAIAKVMRLLNAPDAITWVGVYRMYEVIEEDVGGQHKLEKQGWVSPDDLKRFKHSANSVKVGGDCSRHGKEVQAPPKNPMTLAEAEAFAKCLVQAWLTSKGV